MSRSFSPQMIIVGTVMVLTGIYLLWQLSGGFAAGFMGSGAGILLSTGGLFGVLALGVGVFVSRPALARLTATMARLGAADTPPTTDEQAELDRLRARLRLGVRLASALLIVAVALMSIGPHV